MRRIVVTTSLVYETDLEVTETVQTALGRWVSAQIQRTMPYAPIPHTHLAESGLNITVLEESDT